MATPAPSRSRSASARRERSRVAHLAAALRDDQARPVISAAVHEVGEHLLGGVVGPLDVVDDEHARRQRSPAAATARARPSRNRASRARARRSVASRRRSDRARGPVGPPRSRTGGGSAASTSLRRRVRDREPEQLDQGAVGHVPVVVVAARHQRRAIEPREDLLDETGLAHARLALDHDDATRDRSPPAARRPRRRGR